jgi:hypothetical protein
MGAIAVLFVLLLALILLLPRIINLEPIRQTIIARISEEVGGELEYRSIDLSFFPRPRAIIQGGSLSIPGKVAGTMESLKIYPRILPLLRGRVRIAMLRVDAPEFLVVLPEGSQGKKVPGGTLSPASIQENIGQALAFMASKAPGLIFKVNDGRLTLTWENKPVFWFGDIHGRISLPPDRFEVDLACNSNLWEGLSLEGYLDSTTLKGDGRIDLTQFKPPVLTGQFFPFALQRVGDSQLNLSIRLKTDGLRTVQAEVKGSLAYLTLQQAKEKLVIRGKSLKGNFRMDEDRITASLSELDLEYPQLRISGTFRVDQTTPRVSLELEGREGDIRSIREVALAVAGKIPDVQKIFEIVKGGKVPLVTLSTQGSSLSDLGKLENIVIKGHIREGTIYLPEVDLDLTDVKGEAVISNGVLEGTNLEAKFGNTSGREGIVKLGLEGDDAPFYLNAKVQVDLAQLPSVLPRFTEDKSFLGEISLIDDLRGTAQGSVALSGSVGSIRTKVDISDFNLMGRYGRLPYPLEITKGQFFYDEDNIGVKNLGGLCGKSSFSEVTARVNLGKEPYLEIISGKSSLFLGEIYPWLSSLEGIKDAVKDLKSLQGTVVLSSLGLKGPLSQPEKWGFRTTGEVKNLAIESTLVPGPFTVIGAGFEATPEGISLTDFETDILDASLRGSGSLHGYLEGLQKADFTLQGNVGPKAVQWVSNLVDVPPKLRVRAPLSISQAHGGWDNSGKTFLSADLVVKDGPKVSIDTLLNPEELTIRKLLIQDKESRASMALTLREKELHLDFKGNLGKTTLDGLLVNNYILTGRIQGDLQTHILLDNPMRSTAQGTIKGVGLGHPLELKIPVQIENVSLNAMGNKLMVESALLTWGDSHVDLQGGIEFSEKEFLFDMNLSTDGLEWEKIQGLLKAEKRESGLEQRAGFRVPPVRGTLRIKLGDFKYGRFTWKPLHADISLDHDTVKVEVTEGIVCGISTPGVMIVTPQDVSLDFKPICTGQQPGPILACLLGTDAVMTGSLDLKGEIMGRGKPGGLVQSLKGNLEFVAKKGRIHRSNLLLKILAFVNVTEIFRGKYPDLGKEGFAYDSFTVKGNLKESKLILEEAILDGSSMELVGQGEIDLMAGKMDLTVLVAPLKTVDFAVKQIPLVRDILGGTLVSIPVRVRGDLENPTVSPLSPSAVGSELVGIMRRIIRLPMKIIHP